MSDIEYMIIVAVLLSFIAFYLFCNCGVKLTESKGKSPRSSSNVVGTNVSKYVREGFEERIRRRMAKRE